MTEIINFTTGERYYTCDDTEFAEKLENATYHYRLLSADVRRRELDIELLERREAPNVIPINLKERQQGCADIRAEIQEMVDRMDELEQEIAELHEKAPANYDGELSSAPIERW